MRYGDVRGGEWLYNGWVYLDLAVGRARLARETEKQIFSTDVSWIARAAGVATPDI